MVAGSGNDLGIAVVRGPRNPGFVAVAPLAAPPRSAAPRRARAAASRPLPLGSGSRGDALQGALPAGVERLAGLVEIDGDRGVVGRGRWPLSRLPVDLGVDDPL